jgi:hypothetical protein
MSKSRLVSGRIKKVTGAELSVDRYEFLDLANAEPDLGNPNADGSILVADIDGTRYWTPNTPSVVAIDDLTDVDTSTVPPTDGQALVYDDTSGIWKPGGSAVVAIGDLIDVDTSTVPPTDGQALVYDNTSGIWKPGDGAGVFYSGELPPEDAVVGDLWFDTDRGVLAIYVDDGDSQQWVEVSASGYQGPTGYTGSTGTSIAVSNLYQAGDLIVFTGTQRWYAPYNLTFTEISARVVGNANDDIEIEILKNGTLLTGLTIPVGLYIASTTGGGLALTMNEGEYITVDLIQVGTVVQPGSNLYLQFKYVNN